MTDVLRHKKKDGRLIIILILACLTLFFDRDMRQNMLPKSKKDVSVKNCEQLNIAAKGRLFIGQCSTQREESKIYIPVNLTSFFFKPMDVNLASKDLLMTIKGIGPSLGSVIVKHRQLYGPFGSIDDLLTIKGIGSKRAHYFSTVLQFGKTQ